MQNEVALVMDTDFSKQLKIVASYRPVWIVTSPINSVIVKELRSQSSSYQLTEFFPVQLDSMTNSFHEIVCSLDEHHDGLSQDHPYDTLLVYGLELGSIDKNVLREFGFFQFQKTEYGFIAKKPGGQ